MRTFFKERSNVAVTPNSWVTTSLYKKDCLPVITRNKKHLSKQLVFMIYALVNDFFATATFQGLRDVSFQTE